MLSVVLPTFNEAENIVELLPQVEAVLKDIPHEIIVVDDDSPDRTWEVARKASTNYDNWHVIRRVGRRGLSAAVIEGWLAAKGEVLLVMDSDGQHDHTLIPKLYQAIQSGDQVAIGSRYIVGGSVGEWNEQRFFLSRLATALAKKLCCVKVADPMSGFFAVSRQTFQKALPKLNPKGFKILLDVLVHVPANTKVTELPFTFGKRSHGKSKLSAKVQLEFIEYLYDVVLGKYLPVTFVKYCIVGSLGVAVHFAAFWAIRNFTGFSYSVLGAIETAIIFNFWLNNIWTFARDRLHGIKWLTGLGRYNVACLLGAVANYAVAAYSLRFGFTELFSVFLGAMTGVVWNYTMSRMFTWRGA